MKAGCVWGLVLAALAPMLAGCGSSSSGEGASIRLWSPAVEANGRIEARVSCGGGTLWLPMKWGAAPDGAEELVVYIGQFEGGTGGEALTVPFGALVGEVSPELRGIEANTLPPESSFTYFEPTHSCPPVREGQHVVLGIYAQDEAGGAPSRLGEAFVTALTEEALRGEVKNPPGAWTGFMEHSLASDSVIARYEQG